MVYATISLYQVVVIHIVQCCCAYPINNMKAYILFALIIHTTIATIDLEKLKETAATKLQTITDTATTSLQQFADTIDFEKVQKLDVLHIIPKLQYKGKLIQDTFESLPEYGQKVRFYLKKLQGLTGHDMVVAFDAPWPMRRMHEGY